jgi:hypothetical protein
MAAKSNIHLDMSPMNKQTSLLSKARMDLASAVHRKSIEPGNVEFRPTLGNESF